MNITAQGKMQEQTFQTVVSPSKNGLSEQSISIEGASAPKEPHLPSDFLHAPPLDKKRTTSVGERSNLVQATPIPTSLPHHNTNFLNDESCSITSLASKKETKLLASNSLTTPLSEMKPGNNENMNSGLSNVILLRHLSTCCNCMLILFSLWSRHFSHRQESSVACGVCRKIWALIRYQCRLLLSRKDQNEC